MQPVQALLVPPQQRRQPADEVSPGEINRNVIDLRQVLQDFISEVRTGYVRRDLYEAESKALSSYVDRLQVKTETVEDKLEELEKAVEKREKERLDRAAADRRLIFTAICAPIIVAIIAVLLLGHT